MPIRKKTIAVTIDIGLVEEMERIRATTDAPVSRIVNRALVAHLRPQQKAQQ